MIEIDEVFVVRIVSGLQARHQRLEDLGLDLLALGRGLDHEVGLPQIGQLHRRADPRERGVAIGRLDLPARDLPVEVLLDQRDGGLERVGVHVVEQNIVACQRHHMRDAVTHLPGADDPDGPDFHVLPRCLA